jgi:hypothetical protein
MVAAGLTARGTKWRWSRAAPKACLTACDRIVRENSSYYLIGYYSTNDKADGTTRKNQVKLTRKDTQVLYRAAYVAPRN